MQAAEKEARKKEEAKKLKKQEKAKQKKSRDGTATAESANGVRSQQGGKRSKSTPKKQSGHVFFESSSDEEGAGPVAKKPRGTCTCTNVRINCGTLVVMLSMLTHCTLYSVHVHLLMVR